MTTSSRNDTARERLARFFAVLLRTRGYWRSSLLLAAIGVSLSLFVAAHSKREFRSETTLAYRTGIRAGKEGESAVAVAARLGPKLKDMLASRALLTSVVEEFGLFPEKRGRSILDAVDEMQSHVGFRARNGDSFVVSFVYDDAVVVRDVTARLADVLTVQYKRENLDSATLNRDFLRRELDEATKEVEASSRALAMFLAKHPKFQWGNNESPYAPQTGVLGAPIAAPLATATTKSSKPERPLDRELGRLERELDGVVSQLSPTIESPVPSGAGSASSSLLNEASKNALESKKKRRDAAAGELEVARVAQKEKLAVVTAAHPDAIALAARISALEQALREADAELTEAMRPPPAAAREDAPPVDAEHRAELEERADGLRRKIGVRRRILAHGGDLEVPSPSESSDASPKATDDVVELETEWHHLRMDLERSRDRLRAVQTNARAADLSADAAENSGHAELLVLDPAYVPIRPDKGRSRVFLIGAALALCFTFGLAGLRVLLDDRIHDADDLALVGGPERLVTLPHAEFGAVHERSVDRLVVREEVVPRYPASRWGESAAVAASRSWPPLAMQASPSAQGVALLLPAEGEASADDKPWPRQRSQIPTWRGVGEPGPKGALVRAQPIEPLIGGVHTERVHAEVEIAAAAEFEDGSDEGAARPSAPTVLLGALRVLRHRLEQVRAAGDGHLVVGIVSASVKEGKTTLAKELARVLGESDRARVALVEASFHRPGLARELGLLVPDDLGFSKQIDERRKNRGRPWALLRLGPSLSALVEPRGVAEFPDAIHSQHFEEAIRSLRTCHDYVIVDGPSALGEGDATIVETVCDGVIFVARAGLTKGALLRRAFDRLGTRRALGVVLNDVAVRREGEAA
jgi:Mrp family chromosome partitioning ATPase